MEWWVYHNDEVSDQTFSKEQLDELAYFDDDTLVNPEGDGSGDWVKAGNVSALNDLFESTKPSPPSRPETASNDQSSSRKESQSSFPDDHDEADSPSSVTSSSVFEKIPFIKNWGIATWITAVIYILAVISMPFQEGNNFSNPWNALIGGVLLILIVRLIEKFLTMIKNKLMSKFKTEVKKQSARKEGIELATTDNSDEGSSYNELIQDLASWLELKDFDVKEGENQRFYILQAEKASNIRSFFGQSRTVQIKLKKDLSDPKVNISAKKTEDNVVSAGIAGLFTAGLAWYSGLVGAGWTIQLKQDIFDWLENRKLYIGDETQEQPASKVNENKGDAKKSKLDKLKEAYEKGILTEEEYQEKLQEFA